jgi:hypothetical protein
VDRRRTRPSRNLVLHDATRDIRTPTHELTIARDVLRTRRRVAAQLPGCALSAGGIRALRKTSEITLPAQTRRRPPMLAGRRSPTIRRGRGKTPTTSKIYAALTTPQSTQCWPDRRRRSRTHPDPVGVAQRKEIR